MNYLLSKSRYVRGLQCEKAMWLDTYNPKVGRYDKETMLSFEYGRDFEAAYKARFPNGIDVSARAGREWGLNPELTEQLLSSEGEVVLFEAGFIYDDVLILADVVRKRFDGTLDIFEVKSGKELSDVYKRDASVQYYVVSHCRNVASFSIVHRADVINEFEKFAFVEVDLTKYLAQQISSVKDNIEQMKIVLRGAEPDVPTGQHCTTPYDCPYQHYCSLGIRQLTLF